MKYRNRNTVEAVQFTKAMAEGSEPLPDGVRFCSRTVNSFGRFPDYAAKGYLKNYSTCHRHVVEQLDGDADLQIGDFVVTNTDGSRYTCPADIFNATFEIQEQTP